MSHLARVDRFHDKAACVLVIHQSSYQVLVLHFDAQGFLEEVLCSAQLLILVVFLLFHLEELKFLTIR